MSVKISVAPYDPYAAYIPALSSPHGVKKGIKKEDGKGLRRQGYQANIYRIPLPPLVCRGYYYLWLYLVKDSNLNIEISRLPGEFPTPLDLSLSLTVRIGNLIE